MYPNDLLVSPHFWLLFLLSIVTFAYRKWYQLQSRRLVTRTSGPQHKAPHIFSKDAYYKITPLTKLDLPNEEPLKIRPFKPKYHLTMAIENISINDLLTMDRTYPARLTLRTSLLNTQGPNVLALNPPAHSAVHELYTFLTHNYLPTRFPTLFTRSPSDLHNTITHHTLPAAPPSPHAALHLLGANIDTDLLLLLPDAHNKYRLEAFVTCFPSGFNTRAKLGLTLAQIHAPVPSYAARLEKSMDRFFASLPVGKIVKRHNWGVTTEPALFNLAGNHMSEAEADDDDAAIETWDDIDLARTVLRCERQTLCRLPETGAVLFAFKTYTYGLEEVRAEGAGEELAQAIEGLGRGNAPGMTVYKREVVWGEKVRAFLRGEVGIDGKRVVEG